LRNFNAGGEGRQASLISEALALADAGTHPFAKVLVRLWAADIAVATGHLDVARDHLCQIYECSRSGRFLFGEAACGLYWAWMALSTGDFDQAAEAVEAPLRIMRAAPNNYLVPHVLGCAAVVRARRGDPSAPELGAAAVASARQFSESQVVVMALARAAEATILSERPLEARPLVVELVETLRQLGTRRWVAEAHELAAIVFCGDQPETAAVALGAADGLRRALGEPAGPAFLLGEALDSAIERICDTLGTKGFALEKDRGAVLPVDEALAFVAGRISG
jgi:hypothetical protein